MAEETVERLARMRRVMGKLQRAGRQREFEAVASAYARLKAAQMERAEEEGRVAARVRRAQRGAREPVEEPQRWKLPRGFASPLAAERARSGWQERRESVAPVGGLRPWRRGSLMETRVWRP